MGTNLTGDYLYIKNGDILRGNDALEAKLTADAEKEAEELSKLLSNTDAFKGDSINKT